jgi:hypothetical protein
MQFDSVRYPEWKTLYDAVCPLIEAGQRDFDYKILTELAKVDVRSDRGRSQFYRFRRALLLDKQLWFECVPGHGYSIVPAGDQSAAANKRVSLAKRKVKMAKSIATNVRWEELNGEQRIVHAATASLLHEIGNAFQTAARKFRAIARDPLAGTNTQKLLDGIKKQGASAKIEEKKSEVA